MRRKLAGHWGRPGTWRRPGLGCRRSRSSLRPARTRSDPGVLYPRREWHSRGLGGANARKHGAADTAFFRESRGAANTRRNTISRLPRLTARAPPTKAQSANKWSTGSKHWKRDGLRCDSVKSRSKPIAEHHAFEVQVITGELDPNSVRVELYADGVNGGAPVLQEMKRVPPAGKPPAAFTRASARGARICRLYSASRTEFLRCCGSAGSPSNPMAASVTNAAGTPAARLPESRLRPD